MSQCGMFLLGVYLHEAIRPPCHRDDAGAFGEEFFVLAEAVEKTFPTATVPSDRASDVWIGLITNLPKTQRAHIIRGKFRALRRLLNRARQG